MNRVDMTNAYLVFCANPNFAHNFADLEGTNTAADYSVLVVKCRKRSWCE